MPEFIYVFRKARKAYGEKVILDDVTLSFLPGAKIGVVGPNGAGKSSVLRIMAGVEQPSNGEAYMTPGFTVGILDQEPKLDDTKTVLGNVEDGVAATMALMARFNQVSEELGSPDADYDALLAEMGELQTQLDHRNAWDLDAQLEQAMDALRCPPPDADVSVLSGGERRRVALCKLLLQQPDLLLLDEPTNHLDAESVLWLEQHLEKYPGTVVAVTHDRYFLENVARVDPRDRPRAHVSLRGQLHDLPRGQGRPHQGRGRQRPEVAQATRGRVGVGAVEPEGAAGEEQGSSRPLRGDGHRGRQVQEARLRRDPDPAGSAPGQHRGRDLRV